MRRISYNGRLIGKNGPAIENLGNFVSLPPKWRSQAAPQQLKYISLRSVCTVTVR